MSYRVEKGEKLGEALARVASEEMGRAMKELEARDHIEAVHSSRKALKRVRALLRLLRVAFPRKLYRVENRRLSEAGREISPWRDVHVQLQTLRTLHGSRHPSVHKLRLRLLHQQKTFAKKMPRLRAGVRTMVGQSRRSLASWPLAGMTPATLAEGMKRVYKKGRCAGKIAGQDPLPENLHRWRKKVKALSYEFILIENLLCKRLSRLGRRCRKLEKALGEDHDLFMVLHALREENQPHPDPDYAALARQIRARRRKLQRQAFKLGRKIFQSKARAFENDLDTCLKKHAG